MDEVQIFFGFLFSTFVLDGFVLVQTADSGMSLPQAGLAPALSLLRLSF